MVGLGWGGYPKSWLPPPLRAAYECAWGASQMKEVEHFFSELEQKNDLIEMYASPLLILWPYPAEL